MLLHYSWLMILILLTIFNVCIFLIYLPHIFRSQKIKNTSPKPKAQEIADKLKMLENIIALMPSNVYWMNREGIYLGCNDNEAKAIGLPTRHDIVGKRNIDIPGFLIPEALDPVNKEVMEHGKTIVLEEPALLPDASTAIFLSSKVPLYNDSGEVNGMVGISIDITEKKRADAELAETKHRLEGMTLVSATIAHELRTPLLAVTMAAESIKNYLPDLIEAYKEASEAKLPVNYIRPSHLKLLSSAYDDILAETKYSNTIINMLLTNVDQQSIKSSELKKCSIVYCVDEAIRRYPFQSDESSLVHWDAKNDFTFMGQEILTIHLLFNLLKNAIYYIRVAHKGDIHIWLENTSQNTRLHFRDTGKGIAADDLPKIFDLFFTKTYHGSGVGLAFCKMVMQSYGGNIECESLEGEFTEFILNFPKLSTA